MPSRSGAAPEAPDEAAQRFSARALLALKLLGVLGLLAYLLPLAYSYAAPERLETDAAAFIEWRLGKELDAHVAAAGATTQARLGALFGERTNTRIEALRAALRADVPELVAERLAELRVIDCSCRENWAASLREGLELRLASFETLRGELARWADAKYMAILHDLRDDLRIFLASNAAAFALLLLLTFARPSAARELLLPGVLLTVAVLGCSWFYVFEQDWFHTLLFGAYTGLGYLAYLFATFLMLCDIALNRGRVTARLLDALGHALSHIPVPVPC